MLDIPKLGRELLDRTQYRLVEHEDDSEQLDKSLAIIDTCRFMLSSPTLRKSIDELSVEQPREDVERNVMKALTIELEIREW
jgi:hypothetical protein